MIGLWYCCAKKLFIYLVSPSRTSLELIENYRIFWEIRAFKTGVKFIPK